MLDGRSYGLKTSEHVSNLKRIYAKVEVPLALESVLIPLVILLTYEKFQNTKYV